MYVYIVKSLKYKKHKIVKQLKMFSVSVSLVNDSIVHRCSSLIYVCIIPYVWEGGNSSPTWLSTVLPQLILLLSYLPLSTYVVRSTNDSMDHRSERCVGLEGSSSLT